ncbi:MAG TPA: hypothetical protein VKT49_03280 [Bryobacteraceae bacterium]|nr:hypothetical protein [Bryobacteraceae bacterium]
MRRFVSLLLLGVALGTPVALRADDDNKHHGERDRDRDRDKRYYDAQRRDWHQWNQNEDQAYRRYLDERHERYRDYGRMNKKQQRDYWEWRHNHQDADDRR